MTFADRRLACLAETGGLAFAAGFVMAAAAAGPDRFSVDHPSAGTTNLSGVWWGVGVLGAAFVISFVTLAAFRKREALRTAAA